MALKTETHTLEMEKRVFDAFRASVGGVYPTPAFEHGQWWIIDTDNGGMWSVCDATGPGTIDGFDFECVTEPDED